MDPKPLEQNLIMESLLLNHSDLGILIVDQEFNVNYANYKI